MQYWIAICALAFPASAMATPFSEGLAVETGSPDALCPDLATTQAAIHNRLGTLALESEQRGWTARYTVGHAPGEQGDFVRLELLDPAGVQRLLRDLPRQGESCATLSQAIALVVERYFRELAPDTTTESAPAASLAPVPATPKAVAPSDPQTSRWSLGVSFGGSSAEPAAAIGLQGGYFLTSNLHLELAALAALGARTQRLGASEVELRSYPVALSAGWGSRGRQWDVFAGPEIRWTLENASGSGLHSAHMSRGAAFAAGLSAGLSFWPRPAFGVTARASLDYRLASTAFRVEAAPGPEQVLELPKIQGLFTLGLAFGGGS